MVAVGARDDALLRLLAEAVEVEVDDPDRGVVRHGAAGAEERVVERSRGQLGELRGELRRRRRGDVAEARVVGHAPRLIRDRLCHLLVSVADVDAPQTADSVEVALAVGVVDIAAFRLRHHQRTLLLERGEIRPRMDIVVAVLAPQTRRVVLEVWYCRRHHDSFPAPCSSVTIPSRSRPKALEFQLQRRKRHMKSGVLLRLIFCLGIWHGSGQVSAEEANAGYKENDPAELNQAQAEGTGRAVDSGIKKVVKGDGENIESDAGNPGQSVTVDGDATKSVEEGAGERVDETGENLEKVGECTGKRFKKCLAPSSSLHESTSPASARSHSASNPTSPVVTSPSSATSSTPASNPALATRPRHAPLDRPCAWEGGENETFHVRGFHSHK